MCIRDRDDTCEEPVTENGKTTITCNSSGADYDNATYTLTFTIESVQYDKYKEAWETSFDIASEKPKENLAQHIITNSNPVTVENYTDGNTKEAYTFNHVQTEQTGPLTDYRYIGDSPNNYVYFDCDDNGNNCETWRIIGVFTVENEEGFKEQRVKLIRSNALEKEMKWNDIDGKNSINEWSIASLKTYLNSTYYDSLSESSQNMIGDSKYYLGIDSWVADEDYGSSEFFYASERGIKVYSNSDYCISNPTYSKCTTRTTEWTGKIALLYPSDIYYTFAKGVDETCYKNAYECFSDITKVWINNRNVDSLDWLLTPTSSPDMVLSVYSDNILENGINVYYPLGIRPVLYLTPDIIITSGDGSIDTPYTIAKP